MSTPDGSASPEDEPATRRSARRLLVASVRREEVPAGLDVGGLPGRWLFEAANRHRIAPAVWRTVETSRTAPEPLVNALRRTVDAQRLVHVRALGDLAHVQRTLDDIDIRWAVAKGPVAAAHIWPGVAMRQYADLDVYVAPRDFAGALDALLAAGCVAVDRNWPELVRQERAEFALRGTHGTMIDLHWHIAVRPELRRAFSIDIDRMLERTRDVLLGNGTFPTFDPEDGALLLAFHAAMEGANRLMWMGDVRYAVAEGGFSWELFEDRVRRARVSAPVSLVLARVTEVLGLAEVDSPITRPDTLWGRAARVALRRGDAVFLPGDKHGGGRVITAARPTFLASLVELARARRKIRRLERSVDRAGPAVNPLDINVPDVDARRRYLQLVRASSGHR